MINKSNETSKQIADILRNRLKELGLTQTAFVRKHAITTTYPAFSRILRGENGVNINLLAHYCDLLGFEIKLVKKDHSE